MSFKVVKDLDMYIVDMVISSPLKAIKLYQLLEGNKLHRIQLKYKIDLDYSFNEEDNKLLVTVVLTGDVKGISNVKSVDKILSLLKSTIQTS